MRRPQYLFSGLTKCGVCGSGFIMAGANRLSCVGARYKGICDNGLTIRRDEVESRVLKALQDKRLNQELFEEFCEEFTREMNRLRMEHRASLSAAEREIERIEVRRKKLIEMVMDGVSPSKVRHEMNANAIRRDVLKAKLAAADAPPPLLHPEVATIYRTKVAGLARALQEPESRSEATEALRGLVDAIVLTPAEGALEARVVRRRRGARGLAEAGHHTGPAKAGHYDGPDDSGLQIELMGNLAAMLSAAQNATRSPETGDLELQIALVAGARNPLDLEFCWTAA